MSRHMEEELPSSRSNPIGSPAEPALRPLSSRVPVRRLVRRSPPRGQRSNPRLPAGTHRRRRVLAGCARTPEAGSRLLQSGARRPADPEAGGCPRTARAPGVDAPAPGAERLPDGTDPRTVVVQRPAQLRVQRRRLRSLRRIGVVPLQVRAVRRAARADGILQRRWGMGAGVRWAVWRAWRPGKESGRTMRFRVLRGSEVRARAAAYGSCAPDVQFSTYVVFFYNTRREDSPATLGRALQLRNAGLGSPGREHGRNILSLFKHFDHRWGEEKMSNQPIAAFDL